jgi:hypothetical protein
MRPALFWRARNPNSRIAPFWHELGERTQSLRMSSKREILQGWYSSAYYNGIRQVSSWHKQPARFRHAKYEQQNCAILARNGRTYPVTSYELETRNPKRLVLLSILTCYPTSFILAEATGAIPACQESELQNCAVLARNARTCPVTSYEPEKRNRSRSVLLSMLQCYPTSFMRTQATGTVPTRQESKQQNRAVLARKGRT